MSKQFYTNPTLYSITNITSMLQKCFIVSDWYLIFVVAIPLEAIKEIIDIVAIGLIG